MKTFFKGLVAPVATALVAFLPILIRAQGSYTDALGNTVPLGGSQVPDTDIETVSGLFGILCAVFGWIFWILMLLAIIFVVFAAFRYLTAGGEPEKIKKANYSLIYAVVAIVIALLARSLPSIIGNFMGAGTVAVC